MVIRSNCRAKALGGTRIAGNAKPEIQRRPLKAVVSQMEERNPYKDYVRPENEPSNIIVRWNIQQGENPRLARRILKTLDNFQQKCESSTHSVQVTQPFYVLDGSGGHMASMCVVQPKLTTTPMTIADNLPSADHRSPKSWLNDYRALNQ